MTSGTRRHQLQLAATLTVIAELPLITGAEIEFHSFLRIHTEALDLADRVCQIMIGNLEKQRQKIAQRQVEAAMAAGLAKGGA